MINNMKQISIFSHNLFYGSLLLVIQPVPKRGITKWCRYSQKFRRSEKAKAGIGWDYSQFEFKLYGFQPTEIRCCLKEGTKVFSLKRTCVERI